MVAKERGYPLALYEQAKTRNTNEGSYVCPHWRSGHLWVIFGWPNDRCTLASLVT